MSFFIKNLVTLKFLFCFAFLVANIFSVNSSRAQVPNKISSYANAKIEQAWNEVTNAITKSDFKNISQTVQNLNKVKRAQGYVNSDHYAQYVLNEAQGYHNAGNRVGADILVELAREISPSSVSFQLQSLPVVFQVAGFTAGNKVLVSILRLVVTDSMRSYEALIKLSIYFLQAFTALVTVILFLIIAFNRSIVWQSLESKKIFKNKIALSLAGIVLISLPAFVGILVSLVVYALIINCFIGGIKKFLVVPVIILTAWIFVMPQLVKENLRLEHGLFNYFLMANEKRYEPERFLATVNSFRISEENKDRDPYSLYAVAQIYRQIGFYDMANEFLKRSENKGVARILVNNEAAALSFARGNLAQAQDQLNKNEQGKESSAEILLNQALVSYQLKDYANFSSHYDYAYKRFPEEFKLLWGSHGNRNIASESLLSAAMDPALLRPSLTFNETKYIRDLNDEIFKVAFFERFSVLWLCLVLLLLSYIYNLRFGQGQPSYRAGSGQLSSLTQLLLFLIPGRHFLIKGRLYMVLLYCLVFLLGALPLWYLVSFGFNYFSFTLPLLILAASWFLVLGISVSTARYFQDRAYLE